MQKCLNVFWHYVFIFLESEATVSERKMHTKNYFGRCLDERVENTWYNTFVCLLQLMMMIIIIKMLVHVHHHEQIKVKWTTANCWNSILIHATSKESTWNPSSSYQSTYIYDVCFYIWNELIIQLNLDRKLCTSFWSNIIYAMDFFFHRTKKYQTSKSYVLCHFHFRSFHKLFRIAIGWITINPTTNIVWCKIYTRQI